MKTETERALGELAGYRMTTEQHELLDAALEANPREFERLVAFCKDQSSPIGYLISGAKRIMEEAAQVDELRDKGDSAKAGKRVKMARNYSRTALGLVPPAEQEADLRDNFPWITDSLIAECLALGASAGETQDADQRLVLAEAAARRAYNEDRGNQRLVLTRGEVDTLRRSFPDHAWQLETEFTARGVGKLRAHQRLLEQKAVAYKGGSPAHTQSLHDAEMLGRVVARYEQRAASSPPPSAGTREKEMSPRGES